MRELTTKWFEIVCFSLYFQFIIQLLDSDQPANILDGLNLWAQENRLMLSDSACGTYQRGLGWAQDQLLAPIDVLYI